MAAIDIIGKMNDKELIDYYKYCMVNRYSDFLVKRNNEHYHPSYHMNSMVIRNDNRNGCRFSLYYPNEMYLLNQMWTRYLKSPNFATKCWWESKNIFNTKISYPYVSEPIITEPELEIKKEAETITYNNNEYVFVGSGSKRKVYVSPDKSHVIKIPKNDSNIGFEENAMEAKIYSENPNGIYAKCELIENNWLKMEYVQPKFFTKDDYYPEWTLSIAEHQVGINNNGKLVAYDYGSEI